MCMCTQHTCVYVRACINCVCIRVDVCVCACVRELNSVFDLVRSSVHGILVLKQGVVNKGLKQ